MYVKYNFSDFVRTVSTCTKYIQNDYVERLSVDDNAAKSFNNQFERPT